MEIIFFFYLIISKPKTRVGRTSNKNDCKNFNNIFFRLFRALVFLLFVVTNTIRNDIYLLRTFKTNLTYENARALFFTPVLRLNFCPIVLSTESALSVSPIFVNACFDIDNTYENTRQRVISLTSLTSRRRSRVCYLQ